MISARDRGHHDEPHDSLVSVLDPAVCDRATEGGEEPQDVRPEVGDDRDERAEMKRDVERLVEGVVCLEVRPVEEPRDEDQVTGGRDRQQLRRPLDDAENERLPVAEATGYLTEADRGENDRDRQGHGRHDVDSDAAHSSQYRSHRDGQESGDHRGRCGRPRGLQPHRVDGRSQAQPGLSREASRDLPRRHAPPRGRHADHRRGLRLRGCRTRGDAGRRDAACGTRPGHRAVGDSASG